MGALRPAVAALLLLSAAACSKSPAKTSPCDLLSVADARSIDSSIAGTHWFPAKKGEPNELCVYQDAKGEARLMMFVWRDKTSDPMSETRSGMKSGLDKIVEVRGVGESAAAGFSAAEGQTLKLFAARSKAGMVGFRVRDAVKEEDEKFSRVKAAAAMALERLK
jgi:hypothetical protein